MTRTYLLVDRQNSPSRFGLSFAYSSGYFNWGIRASSKARQRVHVPIIGVGGSENAIARSCVSFKLQSVTNKEFEHDFNALVLIRPTTSLPSRALSESDLFLLRDLTWADPNFHMPGVIDVILGVDAYTTIIRQGLKHIDGHCLIAQNTVFGWTFSGQIQKTASSKLEVVPRVPRISMHNSTREDLSDILKQFWSIEEVPAHQHQLSLDDELCENLFKTTHNRNNLGRFVVRLPLRTEPNCNVDSTRRLALNSFTALQRRFQRDPNFAREYYKFMREYEELGHMRVITGIELSYKRAWYLPHHAVEQLGINGVKFRVVFDASRRTAEQCCLNDFLLPGPSLQNDLSLILISWRQHRFVFTADIVKMFRQIEVNSTDQHLQRILWSPVKGQAPRDYCLTTVTYGTTSAPYLAIRTLMQLADDENQRFPLGAHCLRHHTYVDDIFSGADSLEDAIVVRDQLIAILCSARITLDRWAANNSDFLPKDSVTALNFHTNKNIKVDQAVKTLGLLWKPNLDSFGFNIRSVDSPSMQTTKRNVLSCLARLFDPLGWLSPVIVRAKILLQDLWILKIDWDTPLPSDILNRWLSYCNNLSKVTEISVDRWLGPISAAKCELHGFADASMRAYAAAIYLRSADNEGKYRVSLIIAKTKVAPVKTVTIPNLELCGAVLLVKLFKYIRRLDLFKDIPITAWSDSRDTLAWLRKHPSNWKVFVANRVSYIQTELPIAVWKYIPSRDNPADLATRGLDPTVIKELTIWWQGPNWLHASKENWPEQPTNVKPSDRVVHTFVSTQSVSENTLLTKYSSLSKLVRIVAYCRRFLANCKCSKINQMRQFGYLTCQELEQARITVIRLAQTAAFQDELICLKTKRSISKRSVLYKLSPFLDEQGVIRVGGRLTHSALPFPAKHPPILPKTSNLSQLFIQYAHRLALHAGPTLTLGILLHQVWIIGASGLVKRHVRACIRCFRVRPSKCIQKMGNLPPARVTPSRAFSSTGLDYAGPFKLRCSKGRGQKSYKGYIALFICFSTKAIHLEAVGDLSSQSFIAAFNRFSSRRGVCQQLYSDNGTNFRGADRELRVLFRTSSDFYSKIAMELAEKGIKWEFIPPSSPHFGGLWEAGVKATKHHLIRVIGDHALTFEEFATVLAKIEACLNSRPLCPMSGDIEDLEALTPSHFLTGGPSSLIPDIPLQSVPENRLSRFQLLTKMQQHFWKRWSHEYLHYLQERSKWQEPKENFAVGQLVVVHDDRFPPAKWQLGRIVQVHPGHDGLIRVVTVKTASSSFDRPIVRLSPLPMDKN
ncbi:uncharacterized protein [Prorops nasuta]|uniref:uncharacterized protein n=1 Tax=Prorops nasuta TaxID=863751 RepID=UPI0034CFE220